MLAARRFMTAVYRMSSSPLQPEALPEDPNVPFPECSGQDSLLHEPEEQVRWSSRCFEREIGPIARPYVTKLCQHASEKLLLFLFQNQPRVMANRSAAVTRVSFEEMAGSASFVSLSASYCHIITTRAYGNRIAPIYPHSSN